VVNVGVGVVVVRAATVRGAAVVLRCGGSALLRAGSRLAGSRRAVAAGRVAVPLPRCAPAAHGCDGASALCWPCGLLVGVLLLRWVLWCAGRSRHWGSSARPPS
jgi:hypothetical protein